jgi:tetratricopeptide (TPR) repeat protein
MRGRRARRSACLVVALLGALALEPPGRAGAQDDWALERDEGRTRERPRRVRRPARERTSRPAADLPARYLAIVLADPRDGFAMDRLLALHRAGAGLDALIATLEAERLQDPSLAAAVELVLARLARERGDHGAALAHYEAVTDGPLAWLSALGRYHLARETSPAAARTHLERALSLAPAAEATALHEALAELCLDLHDYDAAARAYAWLARGGESVHRATELARALAARGEHARAWAEYRALAERFAGDRRALAPLLLEVAREELALGRLDEATETLGRAGRSAGPGAGVRREIVELALDAHRRRGTLEALAAAWSAERGADEALGRAQALDELGRDEEAVAAYRRASRARPRDEEPRLGEIRVLLRAARIDEAIEAYRALLRVTPRPAHRLALAELLEAHGRGSEARELLDEAIRHARVGEGSALEAIAGLAVRWGDGARASAALARRVELEPDDAVALVALGDQRLALGDEAGALDTFRRLLELGGPPAARHAELGAVLLDHDRLDEAIAELRTALELGGAPAALETLRLVALAEERAERRSAESAWQAVLDAARTEPAIAREAREHLVSLWHRSRDLSARVDGLRAAFLEREPPDLDAGRLFVEALRRRGDLDGAVAALRRLDTLAPGDVPSLELLERIEVQRGALAGAIDALERLARAEPRSAAARYRRMTEHALELYRNDDALRYARRAVELAPDDAESWAALGALLAGRGERTEGRAALRRALELDPRRHELALRLADEESSSGDASAALALSLGVVEASDDDALVGEAVQRVLDRSSGGSGDELDGLERALLAQILRAPERVALRRIFLDLIETRARELGRGDEAARARTRLLTRGLAPLLLSVGSADPAEAARAIALLRGSAVPGAAGTLLGRAEREGDAHLRLEALAALVPLARREHAERLEALAARGDVALRSLAIWALTRATADPTERARALAPMLRETAPEVRATAALALGGSSDAPLEGDALRAAEQALDGAGGELPVLAWAFARSLPELVTRRLGATASHRSPLALAALARTETPTAIRALVAALLVPDTREAAALALGTARALDEHTLPRPGETATELLRRALGTRPVDREPLMGALAELLPPALIERDPEGHPSATALAAIRLLVPATRGAPGIAVGALGGEDGPRLDEAALAAIRAPLEALAALPEPELAARATALLAAGSRRDDVGFFEGLLDAPGHVLRAALEARGARPLGDLGPIMERALEHADWAVRLAAVHALAREQAREAALVRACDDSFSLVRDAATAALGAATDRSAEATAALLRVCAEDPEPQVRRTAARFVPCE